MPPKDSKPTCEPASNSRGQVMVEGALVMLLLFVFLFAVFEGGRFLHVQQALTDAAREGARHSVAPFTRTSNLAPIVEIETMVKSYLAAASLDGTAATIVVERPLILPGATTEYTRVTVSYPYSPITLGMFGILNRTLTGRALMRNETSP